MIENRRFSPGERINVEKLTEELGVSRTPIWQAVGMLEKEGMLVSSPYKGVSINTLSPEQAISLYSVRENLECMVAGLAVEHIDDQTLARLKRHLAAQERIISSPVDLIEYSKLDFGFHSEIYQSTKNEYLIEVLDFIKNKMRPLVSSLDKILPELYQDHLDIYNALATHDADSARAGFCKHNARMKDFILTQNLPD